MPEELNRLVTDHLSDLLFTPSADADANLRREGVAAERIHRVGNVLIDTLVRWRAQARPPAGLPIAHRYALVTLHRPANVDDPNTLQQLLQALIALGRSIQVIFPVHPRTRLRLDSHHSDLASSRILLTEPLGYLEFLWLEEHAQVVITDSGGVQEETTFLRVPCLTVRPNTERPITLSLGTNRLIGNDAAQLRAEVERILAGDIKRGATPPLWDGHAAERIADVIARRF